MSHAWAILGLLLNAAGAVLLLKFPPTVKIYTADGREVIGWVNDATPEGLRRYRLQKWGFRISIGALASGFILQLVDLLKA